MFLAVSEIAGVEKVSPAATAIAEFDIFHNTGDNKVLVHR